MVYEERNIWASLIVSIVGVGVYVVLVLQQAAGGSVAEVDWVPLMLWTIGGAIVVTIIARILLEIVFPSEQTKPDQRDKEIERTGERVGNSFVVIGALAALIMSWLELDWFWIANVIYLCFVLSAILSSITRLVAYRTGGFQSW